MKTCIKVSLRHNPKNWVNFYANSVAVLLVSPGQPYYSCERFEAVVNALNYYSFKECHIMVGDTVYRHTLRIFNHGNEEELYAQAKDIGLQWVNENKSILNRLTMPFKIEHWDTWLLHPHYEKYRKQLNNFYTRDESFRSQFLFSANEFLERLKNSDKKLLINKQDALESCLEYLKEECAIIIPLYAEIGYRILVYPSNMLEAMKVTHEAFMLPHDPMHWLTLRFERKKIPTHEITV